MHIFPSPAVDYITVSLPADFGAAGSMDILNTSGQRVKTVPWAGASRKVRVDDLPSGVFLVRAQNAEGKVMMTKFVVR